VIAITTSPTLRAADRVADDQEDSGNVAGREDELASGSQGRGPDLRPPQPPRHAFPQHLVAVHDLALEPEDPQLLRRPGTGRQTEEVHRQARVRSGLLTRPIDELLGPLPGDQRREGNERQQEQQRIDQREKHAGHDHRHAQTREGQHRVEAVLDLLQLDLEHGQPVGVFRSFQVFDSGRAVRKRHEAPFHRQSAYLRQLEVGDVGEVA
jgi:hypothetical protein